MHPERTPLRFGEFRLDRETSELFRGDARVRLQEKPLQVLLLLAERAGQLVTRDELRHHLWAADTYVDFDRNLNTAVKKLRLALGDSAEQPRYVETTPRRGYRLIMPVGGTADALLAQSEDAAAVSPAIPQDASSPVRAPRRAAFGLPPVAARVSLAGAIAAALVAAVMFGGALPLPWAAPPAVLAVMAIKHSSPAQHSFSEGVSRGLARSLETSDARLRVVGARAMASYKCSQDSLAGMARDLGVTHVVHGSVHASAGGLRLTMDLIRASDHLRLASETMEIPSSELGRAETAAVQRMKQMVTRTLL